MNELGKKGKRDVRFWKYDDGSFGLIVVERQYQDELLQQNPQQERLPQDDSSQQNPQQRIKKQYVDCGVYRTKTKLNKKIDEIQKQCEADGYDFQKKKIKIENGLKYVSKHDFSDQDEEQGKYGWEELEKFLNSCGTDNENKKEVLRLFSGVLSGYCARMVVPSIQDIYLVPLQDRAPILVLNASEKRLNNTFDFITKAIYALAVPTDTQNKLHCECPPFVPWKLGQKNLDQCSFLWYGKKKNRYPSQYRDTVVLIYGGFFSAGKIRRFIERNRWAAVIIFNASPKTNKMPVMQLSDASLDCLDFDWDNEDINYLIERFVLWLSKLSRKKKVKKQLEKRLNEIQDCFFKYYSRKGIQRFRPTENYFVMLQMLTLELFLDSCTDEGIINWTQRERLQSEWFNLLLPGCYQFLEPEEETISHELKSEEEHTKQVFQTALAEMLTEDHLHHFIYTKPKEDFKEADPNDPSIIYWGCLRWYKPRKNEKTPFRALIFKESMFKEIVQDFLKNPCNVDDFVKDLRSCNLEYLFSTSKVRLGGGAPELALIFRIEKMEFLPEKTRDMLIRMIPESDKKD